MIFETNRVICLALIGLASSCSPFSINTKNSQLLEREFEISGADKIELGMSRNEVIFALKPEKGRYFVNVLPGCDAVEYNDGNETRYLEVFYSENGVSSFRPGLYYACVLT